MDIWKTKEELVNEIRRLEAELARVDITARQATRAAVQENEGRISSFLKNFCGVAYWGRVGSHPEFYDGAAEEITGYGPEEFLSGELRWKDIVYGEDRPIFEELTRHLSETPNCLRETEYRIVHKNGQIRWMRDYSSNRCDAQGIPVFYEGAAYDVTDPKQTEADLMKMRNLESIGTLAGGIAHDFNNLLMAITGYISLAKTKLKGNEKAYDLLAEAERISFTGKDLTHQLITFSKGGEPSRKIVHLGQALQDSVERVLGSSNVLCECMIADNIHCTEGDNLQIRNAIGNILINAKESMPSGGCVSVRATNREVRMKDTIPLPPGDYVQISIEDQGPGIPQANLEKIFDPYYTTKAMGAQRGMGLGLAVVYSILKRHNGCVTVDSTPNIGSTFHLYFPASKREVFPTAIRERPSHERQRRVLFMDDEKIIRDVAEQIIRGIGYVPILAEHGDEAVELYRQEKQLGQPFEAVILDLSVRSGMGGKEALKELIYVDPNVRAIISSGYTNDPVIARYRDYGFIGAITKPYNAEELKELLDKVVESPY